MVIVREAVEADVADLVAIHAAVAAEGRWIGTEPPVDTDRFAMLFRQTIGSPDRLLLVAVVDTAVVGSVNLSPSSPGVLGLGMSIAEPYRGQGIGTALVTRAVEWTRSQADVHKIELEVWPHNSAGIALYRHCGFSIEGRRIRHHRRRNGELWDSVVMGLVVDDWSPGSSL